MSSEYSDQQIRTAVTELNNYRENSYVSHEWEELVLRLSQDRDPQLREKMSHEMDEILEKDPSFKIFRKY